MPGFAKQNLTLMFGTELKKRDLLWKYGLSLLPLGGGGLIIIVLAFLQIKHWLNDSTVSQKMLFELKFQQRVLTGKMQIEGKGLCWYDWLNQFCVRLHLYFFCICDIMKRSKYHINSVATTAQSFCAMSNFMERRIHCLVKMQIYCITQIKKLIWRWKFSNLLPFDFVLVWYCSSASRPNWMWTKRTDKHSEGTYFCICILSSVVFVFCEWSIGYEQRTQTRHMVWAYRHKEREGHGLIKRTATDKLTWWTSDCLDKNVVVFVFCIELYLCLCCSSALPPKTSWSRSNAVGKFWIQEYQKKNWYCAHTIIKQTNDKKADNRF